MLKTTIDFADDLGLATTKLNAAQLAQLHELGGTDPAKWEARDSMELQHPFLHIGGS